MRIFVMKFLQICNFLIIPNLQFEFSITRFFKWTRSWISFINVGWGDSILIQDVEGFDILIDGGKNILHRRYWLVY